MVYNYDFYFNNRQNTNKSNRICLKIVFLFENIPDKLNIFHLIPAPHPAGFFYQPVKPFQPHLYHPLSARLIVPA